MNVSPSFALPLKIIAPYFLFGVVAYTLSVVFLMFHTPKIIFSDLRLIGTIHLFLLGFMMMIIVGAMGQLSVVVAEIHHRYPSLFRFIFPLYSVGIIFLVYSFYYNVYLLPYSSLLILCGLGLFAYNLFVTLKESRRKTAITRSMRWSTLFLIVGMAIGSMMAMGYAGLIEIDPKQWLFSHMISLVGGYILMNVMGVTTVLLPMFGGYSRPSDNEHAISFYTMFFAVFIAISNGFYPHSLLQYLSLTTLLISITYYLWSLFRIFTSRKRHLNDPWEQSIMTAYLSLIFALFGLITGIILEQNRLFIFGFWLLFFGFFGFLIFAHLYKIIPFLVWFEKYASLIEEQAVPTIQEMFSEKWAKRQWLSGVIGLLLTSFSLLFQIDFLWYTGLLVLMLSGLMMFGIIIHTLKK